MYQTVPIPLGMSFEEWGALAAEQFAALGASAPHSGENWVEWAQSLLNFPELVALPDPYGFGTWQEWASRALETNINIEA